MIDLATEAKAGIITTLVHAFEKAINTMRQVDYSGISSTWPDSGLNPEKKKSSGQLHQRRGIRRICLDAVLRNEFSENLIDPTQQLLAPLADRNG